MTIYYVDPVNGSNANNGLAWGTAWKWPPGNGAAVAPGDEIRFAKSPSNLSPAFAADTGINAVLSGNVDNVDIGGSWVAGSVSGLSMFGAQLAIASGTTIPANTKLTYASWSRTQTTRVAVTMAIQMVGIPTSAPGGNLKVVLCSDTAGNTPILTLDGPTAFNSILWEGAVCSFSYNNPGVTLNLTIGSIAIYSINSFVVTQAASIQSASSYHNGTSAVYGSARIFFADDLTLTNVMETGYASADPGPILGRSDSTYAGAPFQVNRDDTSAAPFNMLSVASTQNTSGYFTMCPFGRRTGTTGGFSWINLYQPLPYNTLAFYEAPLTYAGTSSSRIKFTAGWNTVTNVQDGFTNLNLGKVSKQQRKGYFVFSSGGQYIDFERFCATGATFIYYNFNLSALAGLRFFSCSIGGSAETLTPMVWPSFIGAPTIATSVAVTGWYLEKCAVYDWFSAAVGECWSSVVTTKVHDSSKFIFTDVDIVDCVVFKFASLSPTINCPNGTIKIRTVSATESSAYSVSCVVVMDTSTSRTWTLAAGSSASIQINRVAFSTPPSLSIVNADAGAATQASITCTSIFLSADWGGTSTLSNLYIKDFKNVILDGYYFNNQTTSGTHTITIQNSANFNTNNPTATLAIGGPVGSSLQSEQNVVRDFLVLDNPPPLMDTALAPRPVTSYNIVPLSDRVFPATIISNWSNTFTIKNFKTTAIYFGLANYVAGTYWPNTPKAVVEDCEAKIDSVNPIGTVRVFGGLAMSRDYRTGSRYTANMAVGRGVLAYGLQVQSLNNQVGNSSWPLALERRSRLVQTRKLPAAGAIDFDYFTYGTQVVSLIPMFVDVEETSTVTTSASSSVTFPRGLLIRKHSGFSQFWHGLQSTTPFLKTTSSTPNSYGKLTQTLAANKSFLLARIDTQASTTIVVSVVTRVLSFFDNNYTNEGYVAVTITPGLAFFSTVDNHYKRSEIMIAPQTDTFTFYVTPQNTGQIEVYVFATVETEILDFTAVKA